MSGWGDDDDSFFETGDVMDLIMNDDSVINEDGPIHSPTNTTGSYDDDD